MNLVVEIGERAGRRFAEGELTGLPSRRRKSLGRLFVRDGRLQNSRPRLAQRQDTSNPAQNRRLFEVARDAIGNTGIVHGTPEAQQTCASLSGNTPRDVRFRHAAHLSTGWRTNLTPSPA